MRWRKTEWRYRFAWLPLSLGVHRVWLEKYAERFVSSVREPDRRVIRYEVSHPVLGLFEREDLWLAPGTDYITGKCRPVLREA